MEKGYTLFVFMFLIFFIEQVIASCRDISEKKYNRIETKLRDGDKKIAFDEESDYSDESLILRRNELSTCSLDIRSDEAVSGSSVFSDSDSSFASSHEDGDSDNTSIDSEKCISVIPFAQEEKLLNNKPDATEVQLSLKRRLQLFYSKKLEEELQLYTIED